MQMRSIVVPSKEKSACNKSVPAWRDVKLVSYSKHASLKMSNFDVSYVDKRQLASNLWQNIPWYFLTTYFGATSELINILLDWQRAKVVVPQSARYGWLS